MKKLTSLALIALLASCNQQENTEMKTDIMPPIAKKHPKELTVHGDTRVDDYFWMRLSDAQKEADSADAQTQDVLDYLNAENAFTNEKMAHTETFQKDLFEEMKGRIKEDDESVPYKKNGYYYITRYEKGGEYPIHSRKKETLEAEENVLLNVNDLAKGHDYYSTGGLSISPNNTILAYGEEEEERGRNI